MKVLDKILSLFRKKQSRFSFFEVGFHGDAYLLQVVNYLANQGVKNFVETGTNVGSTLAYFAKEHPVIQCLSCEPNPEAFAHATKNTIERKNVKIYNQTSQAFIETIQTKHQTVFNEKTMFWLDAHGYGFDWPLKEEITFIMSQFKNGYILIDDFKIPGQDHFIFDVYKEHVCSFEYIREAIPNMPFELYYPNYSEKTSKHHPLKGWGLIVFGEKLVFSDTIKNFVLKVK